MIKEARMKQFKKKNSNLIQSTETLKNLPKQNSPQCLLNDLQII